MDPPPSYGEENEIPLEIRCAAILRNFCARYVKQFTKRASASVPSSGYRRRRRVRTLKKLPILATIPRSGTWFLRYALAFLSHLNRGGRIYDRLSGEISGDPSGAPFDFRRFKGGPLFLMRGTLPSHHLFIGHTVCPGFADISGDYAWWSNTAFHVAGYDYLHEGLNYDYTPTDLAAHEYMRLSVSALERASAAGRGQPQALVYRNPLAQAASYFRYCLEHRSPAYNRLAGRPLVGMPFRDYLFDSALPSYAKQFISFQAMAARYPGLVRLVPYERLVAKPEEVLINLLNHLAGWSCSDWPNLCEAVRLARSEHLKAVEAELGRSLDGTQVGNGSHIRGRQVYDDSLRDEAMSRLQALGINTALFVWPAASNVEPFRRREQPVAAA